LRRSLFRRSGLVLKTPGASSAWRARGYDCGPEPSLRTAPSSSLSRPSAFPSDSLGRIYTPRAPQTDDTPGSGGFSLAGAGANRVLEVLACVGLFEASCGARPTTAARAAWRGLRGVLRLVMTLRAWLRCVWVCVTAQNHSRCLTPYRNARPSCATASWVSDTVPRTPALKHHPAPSALRQL